MTLPPHMWMYIYIYIKQIPFCPQKINIRVVQNCEWTHIYIYICMYSDENTSTAWVKNRVENKRSQLTFWMHAWTNERESILQERLHRPMAWLAAKPTPTHYVPWVHPGPRLIEKSLPIIPHEQTKTRTHKHTHTHKLLQASAEIIDW